MQAMRSLFSKQDKTGKIS